MDTVQENHTVQEIKPPVLNPAADKEGRQGGYSISSSAKPSIQAKEGLKEGSKEGESVPKEKGKAGCPLHVIFTSSLAIRSVHTHTKKKNETKPSLKVSSVCRLERSNSRWRQTFGLGIRAGASKMVGCRLPDPQSLKLLLRPLVV